LFTLITRLSYGKKLKRLKEQHQDEAEVDKRIIDEKLG
jgi:hypothetical protein